MARKIHTGIASSGGGGSLGSLSVVGNTLTSVTTNEDIVLDPNGTGTVKLPNAYLARAGITANSVLPKNYIDNNISPGPIFIRFD